MAINFSCPHCGNQTVVAPQYAGSSGPCALCGQVVTVPGGMGGMTAAPQPSSAKTVWIVVGIVVFVILALIGTAIYLVYSAAQSFQEEMAGAFADLDVSGYSRESDRDALMDIGTALTQFEAAHQAYPQGAAGPTDVVVERQRSWMVDLEPYIDEEFLYLSQYDRSLPIDAPQNAPFANQTIYAYQAFDENRTGINNWIGIGGVGVNSPTFALSNPNAGFFGYTRTVAPADIRDGLSNTMTVCASFQSCGIWSRGGAATVRGLDPNDPLYIGEGRQFGDYQGALCLFADGSVHDVNATIDPKVFEATATIAGGDTVDFSDSGFSFRY